MTRERVSRCAGSLLHVGRFAQDASDAREMSPRPAARGEARPPFPSPFIPLSTSSATSPSLPSFLLLSFSLGATSSILCIMLSSSYYDEPTLPASPPPSSPPALPAVLSPPPASETQGQRVSVGPMRPLTRRQSAQQHQPQYQQVADVPSSSSVACGQPSGSCSSKGASGRPGRGKENIPPLSSSSSFSSSNSSNGNENAGPSNYASHAADDDDPMRGAGGAESDDGEAADELNIPRAASASSRPTLKRGRTPSMADLNGGGGEVNRRRLARSASCAFFLSFFV